jgi:predicted DNA-binding transcriptional regulator YafY
LSEGGGSIAGVTRTEVHLPKTPPETLAPVSLTPEQAAAVVAALAAHPDGAYSGHRFAALEKVVEVLEPDPQRRAELVASSMFVSAGSDGLAAVRSVVERAVVQRRVLVLRYQDGRGTPSRREVEPQLLVRSREHWFLVAWCRERQAPRWFRLDRILRADVTREAAPRRDPRLLGLPSHTHPAGRALDRAPQASAPQASAPQASAPRASAPRRGLRVLPGGKQ